MSSSNPGVVRTTNAVLKPELLIRKMAICHYFIKGSIGLLGSSHRQTKQASNVEREEVRRSHQPAITSIAKDGDE